MGEVGETKSKVERTELTITCSLFILFGLHHVILKYINISSNIMTDSAFIVILILRSCQNTLRDFCCIDVLLYLRLLILHYRCHSAHILRSAGRLRRISIQAQYVMTTISNDH
jgi:hypothetical protein